MSKEGEGLVELEQVLFRGEAGARAARILHATTNTPTAKHFSPVNFTILSSDPDYTGLLRTVSYCSCHQPILDALYFTRVIH